LGSVGLDTGHMISVGRFLELIISVLILEPRWIRGHTGPGAIQEVDRIRVYVQPYASTWEWKLSGTNIHPASSSEVLTVA
jgi:hypothetical protein